MFTIDQYAYISQLRKMEPRQKLMLTGIALLFCLVSESILVYSVVMCLMTYLIIGRGKTPWCIFVKCMLVPCSFLVLSLLSIMIEIRETHPMFLVYIPLGTSWVGVSKHGLTQSGMLLLKVLASLTSLYFLSLTTPLTDMLNALQKLRCPVLLMELMLLIYRFIFVLMGQATIMHHAQASRLGYKNMAVGLRSFGILLSNVLLQALKINNQIYTSLEARGYSGGRLQVLSDEMYWTIAYTKLMVLPVVLSGCMLLEHWLR